MGAINLVSSPNRDLPRQKKTSIKQLQINICNQCSCCSLPLTRTQQNKTIDDHNIPNHHTKGFHMVSPLPAPFRTNTSPAKKNTALRAAPTTIGGSFGSCDHPTYRERTQVGGLPSLKLTASLPLKMDGWNTIVSSWQKDAKGLFSGAFAVSFREGKFVKKNRTMFFFVKAKCLL